MDNAVSKEGMEMQVVVVARNALPIRSSRWQNVPSSLPVKSKAYSCGRVRHKRGQQNSSKCLDKGLFYPYIRCVSILLHSLLFTLHYSGAISCCPDENNKSCVKRCDIKNVRNKTNELIPSFNNVFLQGPQRNLSSGYRCGRFSVGKRWQISYLVLNLLHPGPQRSETKERNGKNVCGPSTSVRDD